jgi:twitching motility protein PilT
MGGTESTVTEATGQGLPTEQVSAPRPIEEVHVDELLRLVVEKKGSDLHLASGVPPVLRIDGKLLATNYAVLSDFEVQRMIYAVLTDEQIRTFETDYELDCSYQLKEVSRFRVNVYRDRGAVAVAFRVIPSKIPTVRELGLPLVLEDLSRRPRGLILVTGPTGSGKSTTLAAMIGQINNERSEHIITVEDPIEYLHTHRRSLVNQRELGADTRTFAQALRHALREDPDVILVGEMRELDTMALAITAAETGHLVFSTLWTCSPPGNRSRSGFSFRTRWRRWCRSSFCRGRGRRGGLPRWRS